MDKIHGWWFASGDRLPHGDGRLIVIGEAHSVEGDIVLCENALHASRDPFDALYHAPGSCLYKVRCWGDVVEERDKLGARYREYIAMHDATNVLRQFARDQALTVIHLWDAPDVVKRYLETGDETIRAAAWAAAWAAARDAAGDAAATAAWAAAWTAARDAAWAAAGAAAEDAARAAAWAAGAAWAAAATAARDAAGDAAATAARKHFNEMVAELFGERQP